MSYENIDFDLLVEEVKQMNSIEGQDRLWTAAFKLPKWHFIAIPQKRILTMSDPSLERLTVEAGSLLLPMENTLITLPKSKDGLTRTEWQ